MHASNEAKEEMYYFVSACDIKRAVQRGAVTGKYLVNLMFVVKTKIKRGWAHH